MNRLIAILTFVLSLYGCDVGGSTFVDRSDTLYSKVVAQAGVARFECLRSSSGRCYYTVFPRECAPASGWVFASVATRIDSCRHEPIDRFAIAAGDSRKVAGLHRFRPCVSAEYGAPGPDCEALEPMAAR